MTDTVEICEVKGCEARFTGPWAHIAIVDHVSAVHYRSHKPMTDQKPAGVDQPDGIDGDSYDLPDLARAAERVGEFLSWYGDGRLYPCVLPGTEDEMPPLFARDLEALRQYATSTAATETEKR